MEKRERGVRGMSGGAKKLEAQRTVETASVNQ